MALYLDFETLQVDGNLKGHQFYVTCLDPQHFLTSHRIEDSLTGVFWTEMDSVFFGILHFYNGILKVLSLWKIIVTQITFPLVILIAFIQIWVGLSCATSH